MFAWVIPVSHLCLDLLRGMQKPYSWDEEWVLEDEQNVKKQKRNS
jgi:hypothetical protein